MRAVDLPWYCLNCTTFGKMILRKIIKTVATRCQIWKLKCTKSHFRWCPGPDPTWGAYIAPPDPLAGFKGPTSKGREGAGEEGKGWGEGRGRRRQREGFPYLFNPTLATRWAFSSLVSTANCMVSNTPGNPGNLLKTYKVSWKFSGRVRLCVVSVTQNSCIHSVYQ